MIVTGHGSNEVAVRRMLPEARFAEHFQAGRAMSLDAMAAYALEAAGGP